MQNITEEVKDLLPDIVHQIINEIGFSSTEILIKRFGGVTFKFTDGAVYFPLLVEAIGREQAVKLRKFFKSELVYIPRCEIALRALRNIRFKSDYAYHTDVLKKSGRQTMLELCPIYNISDRLGWKIINSPNPSVQFSLL